MTTDANSLPHERARQALASRSPTAARHRSLLPQSLRTRILAWHGALLACVLAAFGITAHRLHWNGELERMDRVLDEPLSMLHRSLHHQGVLEGNPPGPRSAPPEAYRLPEDMATWFKEHAIDFGVWSRTGALLAHSTGIPEAMAMPPVKGLVPFVVHRRSRGDMREAYLITPPGECFLAAASMESEFQTASRLGLWLLALGLGVLAAGLLVDAWILRRSIRPVEEIISAAERISRGNLGTRIETRADTVELSRLTNVLNETFASLDHTFAQQARFSADVAHELRTPVSVLIAEAQGLLERERSPEEYRETLAATLRSARRMSGLIESLLDLARIESGADSLRSSCDLAPLGAEVIESLHGMAESRGIRLESRLEAAPCEANPAQLTQVIANLVINAIQHNVQGGRAAVITGTQDGAAFASVENSGPGIPEEDLPQVFERFYRTDSSRSRKTGGVGLGLSICKAIADAHGAELTVESQPGVMTRISLRLPRKP